jgi:hypothetical protein
MMLGVILEVRPSDSEENRSAHFSEQRRGYLHEADVLLVGTNVSSNLLLKHVVITPSSLTGLDDYQEHLPRGSSHRVDGEQLNTTLANVDPYDLDGDWCVVGFLGGSLDSPFIVTWWNHPRNTYDAATSGNGNPNRSGVPQSLAQQNRYFKRVNGVEHTITGSGDIYLSTLYSNSDLLFGSETPTPGRWPRAESTEIGGSILVEVKESQTLELAWDHQTDGIGVLGRRESELSQSNPSQNISPSLRDFTYITIDKEKVNLIAPAEFKVSSPGVVDDTGERTGGRIRLFSEDTATIYAANLLELSTDLSITLDSSAGSVSISAATLVDIQSDSAITLAAAGALTLGGSTIAIGGSAGSVSIGASGTAISLGNGATEAVIQGTSLSSDWNDIGIALGLIPIATDLPSTALLANSNRNAILDLIIALADRLSNTTKTL